MAAIPAAATIIAEHRLQFCKMPRATRGVLFFMAMDGRYAGNAGTISGDGQGIVGTPEMQEQFPAMAAGEQKRA
jgi:hypothetical protein